LSNNLYQPKTDPGNDSPAPITTQPSQGAPAHEQPQGGLFSGGSSLSTMLLMLLPVLVLLISMRGQNKKQKDLESSLKTGDTVVTQLGLIGKILEMNEREAKLEIAPGVSVRMLKSAIQGLYGGGPKPGDAKDGKQEKAKA
jgi:preprotein translocase subunit YajC